MSPSGGLVYVTMTPQAAAEATAALIQADVALTGLVGDVFEVPEKVEHTERAARWVRWLGRRISAAGPHALPADGERVTLSGSFHVETQVEINLYDSGPGGKAQRIVYTDPHVAAADALAFLDHSLQAIAIGHVGNLDKIERLERSLLPPRSQHQEDE